MKTDDPDKLEVSAPSQSAGGLGALRSTVEHLRANRSLLRGGRALLDLNQPDGTDCPGCAWPEPADQRSAFEFCENGAKAIAWETTTRKADRGFFAQHSIDDLLGQSDHWLGQQGRLTEPLWRDAGAAHYQPVTWEFAFARIAEELGRLDHPDEAVFYTSGRTSNEAAFLYQLFVRWFGTNNLPDCSNMCHESSGTALKESIGVGKGTVQLEDFALCDAIFVIGQNPGTNHPRMMSTLQEAAERGCRIVSINPLAEAALINFSHPQRPLELLGGKTAIANLHLPVKVNGDGALLKGIMKELLEDEARRPGTVIDRDFIAGHTIGFEAFAREIAALDFAALEAESGVDRAGMRAAAEIARGARSIICCWAMGLTQHKNAVGVIQEVVNFLLLRGNLGRPGAGACPVRGHSNVQGDRTMGISERMPDDFLNALGASFGFSPPRAHGFDTVNAIRALRDGRAKVFFAMGGNFLSATPDTVQTAAALRGCRMTVHVATKLNRAHLVTGQSALLLPCLGRTERDEQGSGLQFVTVEDSMGLVHRSQGRLAPAAPGLHSEPAIVAGLAHAVQQERERSRRPAHAAIPWEALVADYDRIRDRIAAVVPGFERMNERVRIGNGFALVNDARERRWNTASGKARFTVHPLTGRTLEPGQLLLTTIRSHDQFNTTVYGLDDRYRGIRGGRQVVFANQEDIELLGLSAGQWVDITSHFGTERRVVRHFKVVPYAIPRGCAAAYFPEANPLVPLDSVADGSNTPTSKSIVVTLAPTAHGAV